MSRVYSAILVCFLFACASMSDVRAAQEAPISIDQALEIAFANSPDIRIAADQVRKAGGVLQEAVAAFRPTLNASGTHVRQGPRASVTIPDIGSVEIVPGSQTSFAASVSAPLDVFGRLPRVEGVAGGALRIEQLNLANTAEQLILDVKTAFFNLLRARGQEEVARAAVDAAAERLTNTEARYRAGTVAKFDLTRAEVEVANLTQRLIEAGGAVETARAALNRQMGIDTAAPTEVAVPDIAIAPPESPKPELVAQALERRPIVEIARAGVEVGESSVRLERMGRKPFLSATGVYNYDAKTSGFSAGNQSWRAMLDLRVPIWDGGVTSARVEQAAAKTAAARDAMRQIELGVALEVRTAALDLEQASKRASTTEKNVELAEEALRLANVRYEAGIATLVEVTDAESSLTQARVNLVNARYDHATALARLQRATSTQPEMARVVELPGMPALSNTRQNSGFESGYTDNEPAPEGRGTED